MRASASTPVSHLDAFVALFPRCASLPRIPERSTLTLRVSRIAVGTRVSPGPRTDPDVRVNASGSSLGLHHHA